MLKKHIIKKYNAALTLVLDYYMLEPNCYYTNEQSGLLTIRMSEIPVPYDARLEAVIKHKYPCLLPFIYMQSELRDNNVDMLNCIKYLSQINQIVKGIRKEIYKQMKEDEILK